MTRRLLLALSLAALAVAAPAAAQWKAGGVAFPITPYDDWSGFVPDGEGGVVFLFPPIFGTRQVRSQHLLADGTPDPLDGSAGTLVAHGTWGVGDLAAIPDGSGGVVVELLACGPPTAHTRCWENGWWSLLRAEGATPAPGWPDTGVVLGSSTWYALPSLATDGAGGAVLLRGSAVQRWTGAGVEAWTPEPGDSGVRFATSATTKLDPHLAADEAGGAWVAWSEAYLNDPLQKVVRLGHVSAAGLRTTGPAGLAVVIGPQLRSCGIVPDGAGGVYVAWAAPGASYDVVRVQHVDATGAAWWDAAGVMAGPVIAGADLAMSADGEDTVAMTVLDAPSSWRVQKLASGAPAWADAPEGRFVGVAGVATYGTRILAAPDGGLFVFWSDARTGSSDPWATRLDADGHAAPGWTLEGTALASLPADEYPAALVSGGTKGEAIACWSRPSTAYPGLYDLVAQKLVSGGVVAAPPAPAALALSAPWPNPASDGWTVSFRLSAPGEAVLELFDVAGRRVERLRVRVDDAAPRQVRFAAGALAPGVYRVRLSCAAGERTRVVVLAR